MGTLCGTAAEAAAAGDKGADFLVMRRALPEQELRALCARVAVPVYARGLTLEGAWRIGASGVSELP